MGFASYAILLWDHLITFADEVGQEVFTVFTGADACLHVGGIRLAWAQRTAYVSVLPSSHLVVIDLPRSGVSILSRAFNISWVLRALNQGFHTEQVPHSSWLCSQPLRYDISHSILDLDAFRHLNSGTPAAYLSPTWTPEVSGCIRDRVLNALTSHSAAVRRA